MSGRWTAAARAIKAHMEERESLIAQLRTELTDARGIAERLQAFVALPDWASLDGSIAEGTVVRFGSLTYEARSTHVKALTRSPLNLVYWTVRTEVE